MVASSTRNENPREGEIRLWRDGEWWIAEDLDTGVTTQGRSQHAALDNLDEAVALHRGEAGREPTEADLEEADIDPSENTTGERNPPDVLE